MKRKIIIIGMDNTGKTTLVNQLSSIYKCKKIKSSGPKLTKDEMLTESIKNLEYDNLVILERFAPFEELIYGKILRNNSKFSYQELDDILYKYNPIIIYCRPDNETIFNFGNREQMEGVIEQKEKLINAWDRLINNLNSRYNIITYDWKKMNTTDLKPILDYLGGYNEYNTRKKRNN